MRAFAVDFDLLEGLYRLGNRIVHQILKGADGGAVELINGAFLSQRAQVNRLPQVIQIRQVVRPSAIQVAQHNFPGSILGDFAPDRCFDFFRPRRCQLGQFFPGSISSQQFLPSLIQNLALVTDELVVLPRRRMNRQHGRLCHSLCAVDELVGPLIPDTAIIVGQHAQRLASSAFGNHRVIQGDKEHRRARIALAPGAATQLVVQPIRAVLAQADDAQATALDYGIAVGFVCPAEANISTAAGHLGGHRDAANIASIGDDLGLHLVIFRVQHRGFDATQDQSIGQSFRFRHVTGAYEYWSTSAVEFHDLVDKRGERVVGGGVDAVGLVVADAWHVGFDDGDVESVELAELVARGGGGAGHAAGDVVAADELLDGHGVQDATTLRDLQPLLGLYRRL